MCKSRDPFLNFFPDFSIPALSLEQAGERRFARYYLGHHSLHSADYEQGYLPGLNLFENIAHIIIRQGHKKSALHSDNLFL